MVAARPTRGAAVSAVDWFPTVLGLAGVPIPSNALLRGQDIADVWHGKVNHMTNRTKTLLWRGGGGPPPCWNRSPAFAIRDGNWKLLFNNDGSRVELYNMDVANLHNGLTGGGYTEANNVAALFPARVHAMAQQFMEWHNHTSCPFGSEPGTCKTWMGWDQTGCEKYPFPGFNGGYRPQPDPL